MRGRNVVPLGRILGIPIGLDYSWFLIFGLLTWSLAASYFPNEFHDWPAWLYWVIGAVTAMMLFASVLLHELGHSIVAMRFKVPVRRITLFIFGGVAQIGAEPPSALAEFLIAIAGPLVSLALALLFTVLKPIVAGLEPIWGLVKYLAYINFALVIFNCIPGFPLDGGRVFRAVVWALTRNFRRATIVAANVGRLFALLFILLGVWRMFTGDFGGGLWIAFIGWFLENAASAQIMQVTLQGALAGHSVAQAMSRTPPSVPAEATLQELVDEHILGAGRRCFLVNDNGHPAGLITVHRIKEVERAKWSDTKAGDVMLPLGKLKCLKPDTELWTALQLMDRDGVNQLPVMDDGHVAGMLNREDVITFLRTLQEIEA